MFTKCTIRDNKEKLSNIKNILCTNRQNKFFKDELNAQYNTSINSRVNPLVQGLSPHDLNLLAIIKHILRRPFYPIHLAGGNTFKGPRGGEYIIKNAKKIYL